MINSIAVPEERTTFNVRPEMGVRAEKKSFTETSYSSISTPVLLRHACKGSRGAGDELR